MTENWRYNSRNPYSDGKRKWNIISYIAAFIWGFCLAGLFTGFPHFASLIIVTPIAAWIIWQWYKYADAYWEWEGKN